MDDAKKTAAMTLQRLKKYEFRTFMVISDPATEKAVSLAITNLLDARATRKDPEITIDISRKYGILLRPSPLALSGQFRIIDPDTAPARKQCHYCRGSGCSKCGYNGAAAGESAEELICKQLEALTGGGGCEFAEKGALGSHFFSVKIKGPKKRRIDLKAATDAINRGGKILLESLRFGG